MTPKPKVPTPAEVRQAIKQMNGTKHKYSAQATTCNQGHKHPSKKESLRCDELHLMQKAGVIRGLAVQVAKELVPKLGKERAVSFVCDFVYNNQNGLPVWEDVKGTQTREYVIKRKLMLWVHGIKVLET